MTCVNENRAPYSSSIFNNSQTAGIETALALPLRQALVATRRQSRRRSRRAARLFLN